MSKQEQWFEVFFEPEDPMFLAIKNTPEIQKYFHELQWRVQRDLNDNVVNNIPRPRYVVEQKNLSIALGMITNMDIQFSMKDLNGRMEVTYARMST